MRYSLIVLATSKRFTVASSLESLFGYWVFFHGNQETQVFLRDIVPDASPSSDTIDLKSGWNLISIDRVSAVDTVESIFTGIDVLPYVWTWNGSHFAMEETLKSDLGYWIYLYGPDRSVPINADP